ncbi:MAG: nucleotide exchange factor GrpE [Thermodesulfobacteriota bacterium]
MKEKKKSKEEDVKVEVIEDEAPLQEAGADDLESPVDEGEEEKTLETLLEEKTDEAARNYDMFLRARADIQNLKKRSEKERAGYISYATEQVVMEILPAMDNLERAIEHAAGDNENGASLVEGVRLTIDQMRKALEKFGVKEIKAIGEIFDPAIHHAISHEESAEAEPGAVIKEFQKGYLLKDKLLRPSIVSVAGGSDSEEESSNREDLH